LGKASGRNVLIALALLALCIAAFNLILTPMYQAVSSDFVPFDLQYPLTREMIIIQLGAMSERSAGAYVNFAALDILFPPVAAWVTVLLWAWLVNKSGSTRLREAFGRGWWIWALFPCLCDWGENAAFLSIILGHPEPMPRSIEAAVDLHRGKMVFLTINQALTAGLAITVAVMRLRRKTA
jgi:hypothetical protein